jgi:meso-butanediol dehydrogenase/(S,S)-butanediol dehydrogenase/diacetyl reductase
MRRFEGKVALVTGAAAGIGRATVERLAREGASLVCADVQAQAVEETAKQARELGADAAAAVCDVSDPESVRATVREAVGRFGSLDVLCNVAGILKFGHTHEFPLEDWNRILGVNLTGTFLACQAAIPHLLRSRGSIVNVASTSALRGQPWSAAYAASKGGVLALTYGLAIEYGKQGVRANAVCPGSISTAMTQQFQLPEGADHKLVYRIMPLDRFRGPETVASTIAFLASEDAAHINGVALRVDGATLS